MRVLIGAALALLASTGATGADQQPAPQSANGYVSVIASVLDRDGAAVTDLQKQDFTLVDSGKAQQIVFFKNGIHPFSVVVLMDFSFSMLNNRTMVKAAAEEFIRGMLPEDTGQVGAFSDRIDFGGQLTRDRVALIRMLQTLPAGNPSRFHDALDASVDLLERGSGHKVVLVFTDGGDTGSNRRFSDVVAKARAAGVMIYCVGLQSDIVRGGYAIRQRPTGTLRQLADETGGRYFELTKKTELGPTFSRLAHELRSVYTLGFIPAKLDGKNHKLEVRVKREGLRVRARRGYVAH